MFILTHLIAFLVGSGLGMTVLLFMQACHSEEDE